MGADIDVDVDIDRHRCVVFQKEMGVLFWVSLE